MSIKQNINLHDSIEEHLRNCFHFYCQKDNLQLFYSLNYEINVNRYKDISYKVLKIAHKYLDRCSTNVFF